MTGAEQGLLLLCCSLGDDCLPLTMGQYRKLRQMVRQHRPEVPEDRELTAEDLMRMGCSGEESTRILWLLGRRGRLMQLLERWKQQGIQICTRLDPAYPEEFRERLGDDAPPVLFLLGDPTLLGRKKLALVGSRELRPDSVAFAAAVGSMTAENGLVLVSGNARGADQTAQQACLRAGGSVIAIVADQLLAHKPCPGILYLSEEVPERGFSTGRALRRNRLIHSAGCCTVAVQPRNGVGGTWNGAVMNLHNRWTPLYVYDDDTSGARALCEQGAAAIRQEELERLF